MDEWLIEGPKSTAKMVARALGIYVSSCEQNLANTFVFESEKYNGSTLTMVGKNVVLEQVREEAVPTEATPIN